MSCRITSIELRQVTQPFWMRFRHNLADRSQNQSVICAVTTSDGTTGYGEALPRPYVSGETVGSCWSYLNNTAPQVLGLALQRKETPHAFLRELYDQASQTRQTVAFGALDLALWDAWSQVTRRSISAALEWNTGSSRCSLNLGLGFPSLIQLPFARRLFRDQKVKTTARGVVVPKGALPVTRLDGNRSFKQVEELFRAIPAKQLRLCQGLEEPFDPTTPDGFESYQVLRQHHVPTIADESLVTKADASKLAEQKVFTHWNLRLGKVGGFTGFCELYRMATKSGITVNLGVMVGESGILQGAQKALVHPDKFAAIESSYSGLLLASDPFALTQKDLPWQVTPSRTLGLGISPHKKRLVRQTSQSICHQP